MKFEVKKQIVTPDGEHHESIEAAKAHMWKHNIDVLAAADAGDIENAIAGKMVVVGSDRHSIEDTRHAIREVFLAAWPRASKGQPRKAREPASHSEVIAAPSAGVGSTPPLEDSPALMGLRHDDEPTDEPETTAKRSHGKKKAA